MRVVGLHVYPVKSLAGVSVESVSFGPAGTIVGDRAWAVQDAHSGIVLSCKREPRLLFLGTSIAGGEVFVHVPGADSPVPVAECAEVLSAWLGRRVRPLPLDRASTALSFDFGFPLETDLGSFADNGGLTHLVTTGTVRAVSTLCAELGVPHTAPAATRRLRPNVVVADDTAHAEEQWAGATLIGARARLLVVEPTERCTMVDHPQPGMAAVPGLLDRVRAERGATLGRYVTARAGDGLRLADTLEVSG